MLFLILLAINYLLCNFLSIFIEKIFKKKLYRAMTHGLFITVAFLVAVILLDLQSESCENDFIIGISSLFALLGYYFIRYCIVKMNVIKMGAVPFLYRGTDE